MPLALRQLMLLQFRGLLRRGRRQARTARGKIFFLVGLAVFVLWLMSALLMTEVGRPKQQDVLQVMPLVLFGITLLTTLTSAGEKAIAFTGGEIDFLFPAPFSRRQLLVFKLVKSACIAALSSLICSVAIYRNATHWLACYLGCVLSLLFVQFSGTAALMIGQSLGDRMRTRGRALFLAVVAVAVILALQSATGDAGWRALMTDPRDVMRRSAETPAGQVLLAPFTVLTNVITAKDYWPLLPLWVLIGAAMNLALIGLIVALDEGFLETAAGASERRYERMRRFRSGGAIAALGPAKAGSVKRRLPMLPRLGGAGPIAWRQLTHALRASRTLLVVLLVLAATVGPILIASAQGKNQLGVTIPVLITLLGMSFLISSMMRFDFRADLDAMDLLKSLPLRPSAVAAGQLLAPTLIMTVIHWIVIAATFLVAGDQTSSRQVLIPLVFGGILSLPFNLLTFAAENLIFLLAPTRLTGTGPGDFSLFGRQIFTLAIRTVGVGIAAMIAAAVAAMVYLFLGQSPPLAAAAAFTVLTLEAIAAVPLVALAFDRFDPSLHMPA